MKLSFSTLGCPNWTWNEILAIAKDLGMSGVELRGLGDEMYAPDLKIFAPDRLDGTMSKLNQMGLEIPILTSGAYFADKNKAEEAFGEACAYIDLADKAQIPYIRVMAEPTPEPQNGDMRLAAKFYGQLCDYAQDTSVIPLIESNGQLASLGAMQDFLSAAGRSNMGVLWDIHHTVRFYGETPGRAVSALGRYIKHVHIKDSFMENGKISYRMMGYGDIPALDALRELENICYGGFISFEWVKRWNPELEEPGIAFAYFCSYMNYLLKKL